VDLKASINNRYNFKYLFFLTTIYFACFPLVQIGLQKPLVLGYLHLRSGSLIFPLTFIITDVIAETYGFQVARQLIWSNIPATIFYILMLNFILRVPSPSYWDHQSDYDYIFYGSTLVGILGNFGVVAGYLVNIYVLSKWKMLIKGKYFWIRSIGSSGIGELIQLLIGASAAIYTGVWQKTECLNILLSVYLVRITMAILLSFPANLLVIVLKKAENIYANEHEVDLNLFKIAIQ
jgi:uncharacterized integral membrane protein (TIGR00697 family)